MLLLMKHSSTTGLALFALLIAMLGRDANAQASSLPSIADLPVIEVPARGVNNYFAVLVSGDGGWARIDKRLAEALAANGVTVVGFDSLKYFWIARTAQIFADDLDRVLRHFAGKYAKSRILLIGFSHGADVLPFALNRLPVSSRALVAQTVLLGLAETTSFQFKLSGLLGKTDRGVSTLPEVSKLRAAETLCLYGLDDDSVCPRISPSNATIESLPGDHHFAGDYAKLATILLARMRAEP